MSNCAPPCIPCQPVQFCVPENFGLTFPSLVGPQGPAGGPGLYVTNYDALRALDATVWPAGYQAVVGGYSTVNDGGGGVFIYVPSATTDDNDGTVLEPANGTGRWFRNYTGPVSVRWFGATGDGATDDHQAIQNAVTYIQTLSGGGQIFLPRGTYNIETAVAISGTQPIHFFGEGEESSIINVIGAINGLEMGSGSLDRTIDLRIANLSLLGDGDAEIGIVVNKLHQILIDRCRITEFTVAGVDMNQAYNNELRDIYIEACGRGIIIDENNEYTLITRAKIFDCTTVGIHFRNGSCSGSKVMFADIEGNAIGIQIDAGSVEPVESMGIVGCYFKDQTGANIVVGNDGGSEVVSSLLIQNNEIKAGTVGASTNTVTLGALCDKTVIMSNTFNACDLVTTYATNTVELGNTFNAGSALPAPVQLGNASGNIQTDLPTADPVASGELWNNGNVVEVSP